MQKANAAREAAPVSCKLRAKRIEKLLEASPPPPPPPRLAPALASEFPQTRRAHRYTAVGATRRHVSACSPPNAAMRKRQSPSFSTRKKNTCSLSAASCAGTEEEGREERAEEMRRCVGEVMHDEQAEQTLRMALGDPPRTDPQVCLASAHRDGSHGRDEGKECRRARARRCHRTGS